MRLYVFNEKDIVEGRATDVYFRRTLDTLNYLNMRDVKVRIEVHSYGMPEGYEWAVLAGIEEVLYVLKDKPFTIYSMPEGTLFKRVEPVMVIEGNYADFAVYETVVLGILRHSTSIATKAARIKRRAMNKTVLFFGLRALHPSIMPMADRSAYIGGADGVSGEFSKDFIGITPSGTMPHALMLAVGDNEKAWKGFDEAVSEDVPRIVLVDTFDDERNEVLKAIQILGKKLYGVRLDTPSSRRGNMKAIIEEIKWNLHVLGYDNIKFVVSGGLDENDIEQLKDVVDIFGVGTSIAFPPSVDLSMDIIEKEINGRWVPITKRGKWPGMKQVFRREPLDDEIKLWNEKGEGKPLLQKVMDNGRIITEIPSVNKIREYVLGQLDRLIQ